MKRGSPLSRKTPLRAKPRTAREFRRIYGGKDRVAWVAGLPCLGCGHRGDNHNHHTVNGGTGRKGDADTIVPLCHACHRMVHDMGAARFAAWKRIDWTRAARLVQAAWEARNA